MTAKWPWLVAFSFGLLHGFGFASALSEIGFRAAMSHLPCSCSISASRSVNSSFIAAVLGCLPSFAEFRYRIA